MNVVYINLYITVVLYDIIYIVYIHVSIVYQVHYIRHTCILAIHAVLYYGGTRFTFLLFIVYIKTTICIDNSTSSHQTIK